MFYSTGGLSRHGYASGTTLVPLSGFQDGTGSFQFQYRNNEGFVSPVITKTFFLDSIAPTAPVLTSPVSGFISNTGTIDFGWTPTTDTGAGVYFGNPLDDFNYTISIFSNTGILVTSGQTDLTSSSLAELSDGIYTARISTRDLAHNPVVSQPISFIVDTTSPDIPTNVVINNNDAINSANQAAVTLIGSGGISESGSVAHYTLSNGTITLSGSTQINSAGSFVFTPIDTTSMGEGILNYSVWMVDVAGNIGTPQGGSVVKSLIPIDGNIQFLSGSHTSTPNVDILLSAGKAVSYELSGSGLATALTGSLGASGSVTIPVVLSNSDGLKTIQTTFTDALGAISNTYAFITLDTLSPNIIVSSHTDNHEVTGSSATLTGTFTDAG